MLDIRMINMEFIHGLILLSVKQRSLYILSTTYPLL